MFASTVTSIRGIESVENKFWKKKVLETWTMLNNNNAPEVKLTQLIFNNKLLIFQVLQQKCFAASAVDASVLLLLLWLLFFKIHIVWTRIRVVLFRQKDRKFHFKLNLHPLENSTFQPCHLAEYVLCSSSI